MGCSWRGKAAKWFYAKEKVGPKFRRRLSSTGEETPHYYHYSYQPHKLIIINAGFTRWHRVRIQHFASSKVVIYGKALYTLSLKIAELQTQYTNFKTTLQSLAQKVGEIEQEIEEHKYGAIAGFEKYADTVSGLSPRHSNHCQKTGNASV